MARQSGYKQVSLTDQAHRALQLMSYRMSASVAEKVTLSQAVLIAEKLYGRIDVAGSVIILECAQEAGIEPPVDAIG